MYFLVLLFAYIVLFVLGEVLLKITSIPVSPNFRLLTSLLLGLLAIPTFYSLVLTGGKTVHLGLLVIAILAYWLVRKQEKKEVISYPFPKEELFCFGGILLVWFIYFYTTFNLYTYGIEGQLSIVAEDVIFYSLLSEQLHSTGVETTVGNLSRLDDEILWVAPYHYFELYFGQFWASCFGLKTLFVHTYISNSFSVAMISYLAWVFARQYSRSKWLFLFCFLSPFCSGIDLVPIAEGGHYMFNLLEMNTFKYSFLFLFFLLAVLLAWQRHYLFPIPLMILVVMNYILVPMILFTLVGLWGLALVYCIYFKQDKSLIWNYSIGGLFLGIFLWGFYALWGIPTEYQLVQLNPSVFIERLSNDWLTSSNIILGSCVYFCLDYIPYLLLAVVFIRYNYSTISKVNGAFALVILPLFFLGGAISYSLLRLITTEAFQPHSIGAAFVGNGSIILGTLLGYKHFQKGRQVFLGCSFLCLSYTIFMACVHNNRTYNKERFGTVSTVAIDSLMQYIPSQNPKIVTLDNKTKKHAVYPLCQWLPYYTQNAFITSINTNILEQDESQKGLDNLDGLEKITPFYQFAQQQKTFTDPPKAQVQFMQKNTIDYLLVANDYEGSDTLLKQFVLIQKTSIGQLYKLP